jgi:hypothetical protein
LDPEPQALDGTVRLIEPRLAERGRRLLGLWPQDGYAALLANLDARIESAEDPDERGRLERFRNGLLGMSRDVATDLISRVLRDITGLP